MFENMVNPLNGRSLCLTRCSHYQTWLKMAASYDRAAENSSAQANKRRKINLAVKLDLSHSRDSGYPIPRELKPCPFTYRNLSSTILTSTGLINTVQVSAIVPKFHARDVARNQGMLVQLGKIVHCAVAPSRDFQ